MNREQMIEYLHDIGKMPDNYYYQVNGKSLQQNYIDIKRKKSNKRNSQKQIEQKIEKLVSNSVDDLLREVFKL